MTIEIIFPSDPAEGDIFEGWQWDGKRWNSIVQSGARANVTIASFAPGNPEAGDLWWDAVSGNLFVYFDDGDSSQWVISNTNAGPMGPPANRNYVDNALFNVWQRGTGPFNTNGGYGPDRWSLYFANSATTMQQWALTDAARVQIGDEAARFSVGVNAAAPGASGAVSSLQHPLEFGHRFSGKTFTLSFWALGGVANQPLGVSPYINGAYQPGVVVQLQTVWARYSVTFTVPSTAGVANPDAAFWLSFWLTGSADMTNPVFGAGNLPPQTAGVQLWGVQLEEGMRATALEKLNPQVELANCQRYYCTARWFFGGYAVTGVNLWATVTLPVTMRAVPSVTVLSVGYSPNASALALNAAWPSAVGMQLNATTTATIWANGLLGCSAEAGL